jgi:hypothetical protein
MLLKALSLKRYACALCLCLGAFLSAAQGQEPVQSDDVVRVSSELVQTDVMVFDKQGKFIENLEREQFELKIDGKAQPISFFERVKAGSINEDAQLAAARGGSGQTGAGGEAGKVVPLDRGRIVLFYVDDLHLSVENMQRVRVMLLRFIEDEMGQNDEAAIASTSGQIGFLQQLTNDKVVLRAAVNRLQARTVGIRDFERPTMTALQSLAIERYDQDVTNHFVDRMLVDNPGMPREMALGMVRRRATAILQQSSTITSATLQTLNSMIRSAGEMPGRKLLFFVSEGFLIDDQTANITSNLRRIADSAARAGVVIYSMDARGLISGATDATVDGENDPTGRLQRISGMEITATQAPLRSLAADSGGRAILNTNALLSVATTALKETSTYYLLAWRPNEEQQNNKFRKIEVSVKGRPDLVVRVRKGFIEQQEDKPTIQKTAGNTTRGADTKAATEDALLNAIQSRTQLRNLPTVVFVSYADAPQTGTYVTISMETNASALEYVNGADGKPSATVDVGGIVFNDQGKLVTSFQNQLTVKPPANLDAAKRGVAYNFQANLKPGLYQVRVAARDSKSGRTGSAVQWIEIPDLATRRLFMSSLIVGERTSSETVEARKEGEPSERIFLSVSRRFTRNSRLRFLTQIYNAATGTGTDQSPDVALQVQIFRDNQPILTTPLSKIETKGVQDLTRLPYAAEIPLDSIPAGRYRLQVTVIDRIAKTSASQQLTFEIG